ncbi:cation-transporting P-type ATPase [Fluoribacter gormanii]|uniref:cation-translocating P-type ATPase n=1 Tax=Fluoribacter gormanii TaxID=464 RepID=UPI002244DB28|nr:cation-transporting P-type ATPase [Fluoribacter gormanii]MCW8471545.1 cation-transporting P-type ATPase [Fluoribacter gormanii]
MKIYQLEMSDVFASLHSGPDGLSPLEADRRLKEYGLNCIPVVRQTPLWLQFFYELTHFFSLILWVAATLAFLSEWADPGKGMAKVGYAVVIVIIISALFSFWQEYRIEKTLAALQKLLPTRVKTIRDNLITIIPAEQLVPGDVILLEQGDNVPADARVIEAYTLRVNNATITGESHVQSRNAKVCIQDSLLSANNVLLAGTVVVSGEGKAIVFATGMQSEFGKIAHLTQHSKDEVSPLRKEVAYVSYLIAAIAIVLGISFFIVGHFLGIPLWQDAIFAIGILIAMVPEGFLPTLTLSLVLAAQRMVKRNVLIRHLPAIEALGSTTVICTDKTGTLTQNCMTVEQLVLGITCFDRADINKTSPEIVINHLFFECAAYCHDLHGSQNETWLGDPMEVALLQMAKSCLPTLESGERLHTIPFDSDRMRLSIVQQYDAGVRLFCKGAPESVLPLCTSILINGKLISLDEKNKKRLIQLQLDMAEKGLRVLAFACKNIEAANAHLASESELTCCGLVGLDDPPRPEVPAAIARCLEAGVRVIMITGDHPRTAVTIAQKINLLHDNHPLVITGDQLRHFSMTQLQLALDNPQIIFARVKAEQKMRIVQALKMKGHIVAVTGDGVNDAPALKSAHIGIAMGMSGTDVARSTADMILLDDNFASIVNGIEEGRAVFANIRKFLTYVLAHNVPELMPYLGFVLFKIPLALTPLQILAIDMGSDSLTALGLGVESPNPELMRKPPRPINERLMNPFLAMRAYCFLGLMEAIVAMGAFFYVLMRGGWHYGQVLAHNNPLYLQATTAYLSTIIVMQIVNVYLCRSTRRSLFSIGLGGNALITWGVLLEIIVLIVINYTPLGNYLLDTAPLPLSVWVFILPFAFILLALEELRKAWMRR